MRKYLFCVGGTKLEFYGRQSRGRELLLKGMVYEWRGEKVPDPDFPGEFLLRVCRPWLGSPFFAHEDEFIPLEEVHDFFDDGEEPPVPKAA